MFVRMMLLLRAAYTKPNRSSTQSRPKGAAGTIFDVSLNFHRLSPLLCAVITVMEIVQRHNLDTLRSQAEASSVLDLRDRLGSSPRAP